MTDEHEHSSVWGRTQDGPCLFKPYALKPPGGHQRTPHRALERVVYSYMRPGDRFLETCAGWFSFSCTAVMHGYTGDGVDLWDKALGFANAQRAALPEHVRGRLGIVHGDALELPYSSNHFDYAYSSLPAYRLSKYGDDPRSLERAEDWWAWRSKITDLFAETARVVKPAGLITVIVTDRRVDGVLHPEHVYYLDAALQAGLSLHDIAIQHTSTMQTRFWRMAHANRHTAKAHEYVLTFKVLDKP